MKYLVAAIAAAYVLTYFTASAQCTQNSDCAPHGTCNTTSTYCSCDQGWAGLACDEPCDKLDVLVVLDSSGSIKVGNWTKVLRFGYDVMWQLGVDNADPDKSHGAMMKYSDKSVTMFQFSDTQHNHANLEPTIMNEPYMKSSTHSSGACKYLEQTMWPAGSRTGLPRVTIFFTDGVSNVNANLMEQYCGTDIHSAALNTQVFAIFVGTINAAQTQELDWIATDPDSQNKYVEQKFEDLKKVINDLLGGVCKFSNLGQCISNPCLNGGTCNNINFQSWTCTCAPGYFGPNCGIQQDPCHSQPCQNGGVCTNIGTTGYSCSCPTGTSLPNCHKHTRCEGADISVLLDRSGSVDATEWQAMTSFLKDYVDSMPDVGQDKTRISFHSFNKDAHTHILMNEPTDRAHLKSLIESRIGPLSPGFNTKTSLGIAEMSAQGMNAANGMRDSTHKKITMTFVDGISGNPPLTEQNSKDMINKMLGNPLIESYAIGIGQNFLIDELKRISQDDARVFLVPTFFDLKASVNQIMNMICNPDPCSVGPSGPCQNGGVCKRTGTHTYTCNNCNPGWYGQNCTTPVPPKTLCNDKIDMAFVIDDSGSIDANEFSTMKEKIMNIVSTNPEAYPDVKVSPTQMMLSFTRYSVTSSTFIPLTTCSDKPCLYSTLNTAYKQVEKGATRINKGLTAAKDYALVAGARPDARKVCVVITDGRSSNPGETIIAADLLRKLQGNGQDTEIWAMGITNSVFQDELEKIAGDPFRVIRADDFNDVDVKVNELLTRMCSDMCVPSPCQNGGNCIQPGKCNCPSGTTGPYCQAINDPCSSSPCYNAGLCTATGATTFTCKCVNGWTGNLCQNTPSTPCATGPCQNGANCIPGTGQPGYTCTCLPGFTGTNCQTPNPCYSSPCNNGGTCVNGPGAGFTCDCSTSNGFKGPLCDDPDCEFRDWCFLVDSSGSVSAKDWEILKFFVINFESRLNISDTKSRASFITYSKDQVHVDKMSDNMNDMAAKALADSQATRLAQNTRSSDGMKYMFDNCFSPANGGRTTVKDQAIFITDGVPSNHQQTIIEAAKVRNSGIDLHCIGVGQASQTQLNEYTDPSKVHMAQSFSDVLSFVSIIGSEICQIPFKGCMPNACMHGAACTNNPNNQFGITCTCPPGFFGQWCELDTCQATQAQGNPHCKNGGVCSQTGNTPSCACAAGWSGPTCTVQANPNEPNCVANDISLIIDSSGSVQPADWPAVLSIANGFIGNVDVSSATNRIQVIVYSATAVSAVTYYTSQEKTVIQPLVTSFARMGQNTRTHLGIKAAVDGWSNGGRAGTDKIVVLITDGGSSVPASTSAEASAMHNAAAAQGAKLNVFAVGKGSVNQAELMHIVGQDANKIKYIADWSPTTVTETIAWLTSTICQITPTDNCTPNPCINGGSCTVTPTAFTCNCPNPFYASFCQLKN